MTDSTSGTIRRAVFRKSSFSGQNAQCVEVARTDTLFGVRDSKNSMGPVLSVEVGQGRAFLTAIRDDRFDRS